MKIKENLALLTVLSISLLPLLCRATDITATNSGNWSDVTVWDSGTVPGATDDVDVPFGINVTVDGNQSIGWIYDYGTVTMGVDASLNVFNDSSISPNITLITTAPGNTVIYSCNPYDTKQCNYYNLVLANTNWVNMSAPYVVWQDFNNFSIYGPTPMMIAGNLTLMGAVKVQQGSGGAPINVGGNLTIGAGCAWDCSGDNLTVVSNLYIYGLMEDLNGALGSTTINGNVIVAGPSTNVPNFTGGTFTNGWFVSDVTTWSIGGSFTNDGAIYGKGFGSLSFDGMGSIAGSNALTLPTMTVNGTYAIADTITLTTNTPTLNGTLLFDLARTNQIVLRYSPSGTNAQTTQTNYYDGNLIVVNSGMAPAPGATYKFFSASNYAGAFVSESFPTPPAGLSWLDNLATSGSISLTGGAIGSPVLTWSISGGLLTLSWDSTTFPGYSVKAQTNSAGIGPVWSSAGGGTVSPFHITIDPKNPPVFFRLSKP